MTFGAPMVTDAAGAAILRDLLPVLRVTHERDPVPLTPLASESRTAAAAVKLLSRSGAGADGGRVGDQDKGQRQIQTQRQSDGQTAFLAEVQNQSLVEAAVAELEMEWEEAEEEEEVDQFDDDMGTTGSVRVAAAEKDGEVETAVAETEEEGEGRGQGEEEGSGGRRGRRSLTGKRRSVPTSVLNGDDVVSSPDYAHFGSQVGWYCVVIIFYILCNCWYHREEAWKFSCVARYAMLYACSMFVV